MKLDHQQIYNEYMSGMSQRALARKYKCGKTSIQFAIKKHKDPEGHRLEMKKHRLLRQERTEIIKQLEAKIRELEARLAGII